MFILLTWDVSSSAIDPTHVIGLYPDLLPSDYRKQLHYPNPLPSLSGVELERAHLALIDYLTQVCTRWLAHTLVHTYCTSPTSRYLVEIFANLFHFVLLTFLHFNYIEAQSFGEAAEWLWPLHHIPAYGGHAYNQKPQEASSDHRHHPAQMLPPCKANAIYTFCMRLFCLPLVLDSFSQSHIGNECFFCSVNSVWGFHRAKSDSCVLMTLFCF